MFNNATTEEAAAEDVVGAMFRNGNPKNVLILFFR